MPVARGEDGHGEQGGVRLAADGRPDLPILLVHGEADPIVPVDDARHVAGQLRLATLRTFPGDLHDVLNEHDRDAVHDAAAFLNSTVARLPIRA